MAVTVHYIPMEKVKGLVEEDLNTKEYLARVAPLAATFQISDAAWQSGDAGLEGEIGGWARQQGATFGDFAFFIGGSDYTVLGDNFPTRESEVLAQWPNLVDRIE